MIVFKGKSEVVFGAVWDFEDGWGHLWCGGGDPRAKRGSPYRSV